MRLKLILENSTMWTYEKQNWCYTSDDIRKQQREEKQKWLRSLSGRRY